MKTIVLKILNFLARLTLKKFKPKIIGITGSVGKTSTKEAIYSVIKHHIPSRANLGSYNNEFGLPLTILGFSSPGKNWLGWIAILLKSFFALLGSKYPKALVLEMGADRPGDINRLFEVLGQIDIAVVTDIGISHLQNYPNQQSLVKEKMSIISGLKNDGTAVLNIDNEFIKANLNTVKKNKLTFGFSESDLMATDFQVLRTGDSVGINFKVHYKGTVVPFFIPNSLGQPNVYAALVACAVALSLNLNLVNASEGLRSFEGPAGRLKYIKGIKRTWIIDDTYNAAPASTMAALNVLKQLATARKVAVIGNMAELGDQSESGHRQVGVKIQETGASLVILVGDQTKYIQDELQKRKFDGKVAWFADSDQARMPVQNLIMEGDTILIKGSQSARMEKIVKEIMADPMNAEKLLVRQSETWLKT